MEAWFLSLNDFDLREVHLCLLSSPRQVEAGSLSSRADYYHKVSRVLSTNFGPTCHPLAPTYSTTRYGSCPNPPGFRPVGLRLETSQCALRSKGGLESAPRQPSGTSTGRTTRGFSLLALSGPSSACISFSKAATLIIIRLASFTGCFYCHFSYILCSFRYWRRRPYDSQVYLPRQ